MNDTNKGTPEKKLYTRLRLWQFPDKYVLEPIDGTAESFLSISRFDGSINLIGELSKCSATESPNVRTIYGVIGMLKLLVGMKLIEAQVPQRFENVLMAKPMVKSCRLKSLHVLIDVPGIGSLNGYLLSCKRWLNSSLSSFTPFSPNQQALPALHFPHLIYRKPFQIPLKYLAKIPFNLLNLHAAGAYLLVITERESIGSYLGHAIYRVSGMQILPCNHSLNNSSAEQKKMEAEFSVLLNAAEGTSGLYFSYDVNLTLCLQRLHELGNESKLLPLWRQAEPRFLWNSYMLEALIDNKLDSYVLPIIQGSYQNFQAAIGPKVVDVTLIARRCTRRTGTRMWRRGADMEGYVANFVESRTDIAIKRIYSILCTSSRVHAISMGADC
ncbi:unnamed protein product [Musa textilis]